MKLLHILFALLATMAIVSLTAFDLDDYDSDEPEVQTSTTDEYPSVMSESKMQDATTSLRGVHRLLAQKTLPANYTCDKFPRVCRLKTSPGPDCCKKKCVNVKKDRLNCGMCGYKCKYTEICCRGKCVNASSDKRHCGGCNQKCKKGEFCAFGMCNYA